MLRTKRNKKKFYKKGEYSNPFFKKEENTTTQSGKSRKKGVFKLKILLILAIFFLFAWFMFFSHFFAINNINTSGEGAHMKEINDLAWEQANSKKLYIIPQRNINLFSKKELEKKLNEKYFFDKLEIKKHLPSTISINLKEKTSSLVWVENDNYYFIDIDGNIIEKTSSSTNISNHFIVRNVSSDESVFGRKIINKDKEIKYISDLIPLLRHNYNIKEFLLDDNANTVKVLLESKNMIYFNIEEDINKQILKLKKLSDNPVLNNFDKLEYIDLRYGDKIYYK